MENFRTPRTLEQNPIALMNCTNLRGINELSPSEKVVAETISSSAFPGDVSFNPVDQSTTGSRPESPCSDQVDDSIQFIGKISHVEPESFVFDQNDRELSPIPKLSDNYGTSYDTIAVTKRISKFDSRTRHEDAVKKSPPGLFIIKQAESDRSSCNEDSNYVEDEELVAINCRNKDDSEFRRDSDLFNSGRSCIRFLQSDDSFHKHFDPACIERSCLNGDLPNPVSDAETTEDVNNSQTESLRTHQIPNRELSSIVEKKISFENRSPKAAARDHSSCEPFVPIQETAHGLNGGVHHRGDAGFEASVVSLRSPLKGAGGEKANCQNPPNFKESSACDDVQNIGLSSQVFIQKLRGAAFRRRMNLTRSRDSLAAKEKVHRQAIAASKAARTKLVGCDSPKIFNQTTPLSQPLINIPFKARRVPRSSGVQGAGGLSGVPKVLKRPATVPASPLLGRKRDRKKLIHRSNRISITKKKLSLRPISDSFIANFSVSGIPKVEKKPATVPISPGLGTRRARSTVKENAEKEVSAIAVDVLLDSQDKTSKGAESLQENSILNGSGNRKFAIIKQDTHHPTLRKPHPKKDNDSDLCHDFRRFQCVQNFASNTHSRKSLFGLRVLDSSCKENIVTPRRSRSIGASSLAFVPHSTDRSKKRAEFDANRLQNEKLRLHKEHEERLFTLKELKNELNKLKETI